MNYPVTKNKKGKYNYLQKQFLIVVGLGMLALVLINLNQSFSSVSAVDDTQSPTTPQNVSELSGAGITWLEWGRSSDNVGVSKYRIYKEDGADYGIPNDEVMIAETAFNYFYDIHAIEPERTIKSVYYYITAVDEAGNESTKSIPLGDYNESASSTEGIVIGKVRDINGAPIPGSTVSYAPWDPHGTKPPGRQHTISTVNSGPLNLQGYYEWTIPQGTYLLTAKAKGYVEQRATVDLKIGVPIVQSFSLKKR